MLEMLCCCSRQTNKSYRCLLCLTTCNCGNVITETRTLTKRDCDDISLSSLLCLVCFRPAACSSFSSTSGFFSPLSPSLRLPFFPLSCKRLRVWRIYKLAYVDNRVDRRELANSHSLPSCPSSPSHLRCFVGTLTYPYSHSRRLSRLIPLQLIVNYDKVMRN